MRGDLCCFWFHQLKLVAKIWIEFFGGLPGAAPFFEYEDEYDYEDDFRGTRDALQ